MTGGGTRIKVAVALLLPPTAVGLAAPPTRILMGCSDSADALLSPRLSP